MFIVQIGNCININYQPFIVSMKSIKLNPFLKLLRPEQWLKNIFVLGPLFFSMNLFNFEMLKNSVIALLCFILASSLTYILNDLHDIKEDQFHPKKKLRPIASGLISKQSSIIFSLILLTILYIILFNQLNNNCILVVTTYLFFQVFYTLKLKYIVILDVIVIASGFVLRVILGGHAINVSVSTWIIITTFFLALFLGFGKRYNEYNFENYIKVRHPNNRYDVNFLLYLICISCTCSIVMYGLFLVETAAKVGNQNLIYSLFFVIFGLFRYLQFLILDKKGGEPEIIFFQDIPFIFNALAWASFTLWIMY